MRKVAYSKPCAWCGQSFRGHLQICELCRRETIQQFLRTVKSGKGVSAGRPLNPEKPSDRTTASGDTLRNRPKLVDGFD
jgi:hypothetical protein